MFASFNMLHSRGRHPLAASRVADFIAAGATVTDTQKSAINDFFWKATDGGFLTPLKRFYLPIWGVAAANAIDLITGASGTFNGSVTHASGYVQGDGSTGYFATGANTSTIGFTSTSAMYAALVYQADTRGTLHNLVGANTNAFFQTNLQADATSACVARLGGSQLTNTTASSLGTGIAIANRNATELKISLRKSSGVTRSSGNATTGTIPNIAIHALAINDNGSASLFSQASIGVVAISLGLSSDALVDSFALSLKNLWETCTGLTLP